MKDGAEPRRGADPRAPVVPAAGGARPRGRASFAAMAAAGLALALLPGACAGAATPPRRTAPPPAPPLPDRAPPAPPPGPSPAVPDAGPSPPRPPDPPERTGEGDPATVSVTLCRAGPRRGVRLRAGGPWTIEGDRGRVLDAGRDLDADARLDGATVRVGGVEVGPRARVVPGDPRGTVSVDGVAYAGTVSLGVAADGTLEIRNDARLDDYLEGVLAGEMPASFPPEALRAQAVLARSFALAHRHDLTDDPRVSQAYPGVPPATVADRLRAAVASTRGLRLVDAGGAPLVGYWYHSTCGGHTAPAHRVFPVAATPPYAGVPCDACGASRYHRWIAEIPEPDVRAALLMGSPVAAVDVPRRDPDGRAAAVRGTTAAGATREVPGVDFRRALGPDRLRSVFLDAAERLDGSDGKPRAYRFRGRGWGHGVGLCQMGAGALAGRGWTAERILAHYYPGSRLVGGGGR